MLANYDAAFAAVTMVTVYAGILMVADMAIDRTQQFYFHFRQQYGDAPAGYTVTKQAKLPDGDFVITEYTWHDSSRYLTLWFMDSDEFTEDERNVAAEQFLNTEVRA